MSGQARRVDLMEEAEVHALGKDLVSRLAMLIKTVRIHSVNNAALQYSVKIFDEAANALYAHLGDFTLRGDADAIFVDDHRIRPEIILWDNIVAMMRELAKRQVGGLTITGPLNPLATRGLLQTLLDHPEVPAGQSIDHLNQALHARGVHMIRLLPRMALVADLGMGTEEEAKAKRAIRLFAELLVAMNAYYAVEEATVPEVLRARLLHAVQATIDLAHEEPYWLVATSTWRDRRDWLSTHAVTTALLAMAMGQRLELGRKALLNLGMSALFADSGLRRLGIEPDGRAGKGSRGEELGMDRHPLESIKEILQSPALTRGQRDRLLVAYEVHIGHDGTGFPRSIPGKPKHLFSSIVTLADRYIELTSDRPGESAVPPPWALEDMHSKADAFEPRLLKIFIHLLGPFPVGTVVKLTTGEMAVVVEPPVDHRMPTRPVVRIVADRHRRPTRPTRFDLSARRGNRFVASVAEVLPHMALPGELKPAQVVLYVDDRVEQA